MSKVLAMQYIVFSILLLPYSYNCLYLVYAASSYSNRKKGHLKNHPKVSVHLPVYNEKYVVSRLIRAVCSLDWPLSRLEALYDYYYDEEGGDEVFPTLYPYAVSSGDIVVGGPIVNEAASYFTDALIYTEYCDDFYSPACWARTSQPSLASLEHQEVDLDEWPADELWYGSDEVGDRYGYALVSTYKDLNGTVGLIVYGYTAEDTYYACYALRGGLLPWLQMLQEGVTTLILEFDYEYEHPAIGDYYEGIHPVGIHVKECLGTFTECTGFDTNFKTDTYENNLEYAAEHVEEKAEDLGICYKLVDITWCAQVHPDP